MTPKRYEYIGDGRWSVWVNEAGTGDAYVTVDSATGDFHG